MISWLRHSKVVFLLACTACEPSTSPVSRPAEVLVTTERLGIEGGRVSLSSGAETAIAEDTFPAGTDVTLAHVAPPRAFESAGYKVSLPIEVFARDLAGLPLERLTKPLSVSLPVHIAAAATCVLLQSTSGDLYLWEARALRSDTRTVTVESPFFGIFQVRDCKGMELAGFTRVGYVGG